MKHDSMEKSFVPRKPETVARLEEIDFALESLVAIMQERTMFTRRELMECADDLLDRRNDILEA